VPINGAGAAAVYGVPGIFSTLLDTNNTVDYIKTIFVI